MESKRPTGEEQVMTEPFDVAVIGAGAAGLMAAIAAARAAPTGRVIAVDGAQRLGAKILIAGGGRCNVTHREVRADDFAGASSNSIRKVLRAFDVTATVAFFEDLGVPLKTEDTGKLFPTTNRARTVLDALLEGAAQAGVTLRHPFRVDTVTRDAVTQGGGMFQISDGTETVRARRVVLATGGQSVVQTGSDGHGYHIARSLGHTVTEPLLPGLVPLRLPEDHFICSLPGIASPVRITVRDATGRSVAASEGAVLCTHFGISGPVALDISRHWLMAHHANPAHTLDVAWLPKRTPESLDKALRALGLNTPHAYLQSRLPTRLAEAICVDVGIGPEDTGAQLTKSARKALIRSLTAMPLPVQGARGWPYAEVTAGGVPLPEVDVRTMASRKCPGLFLCGEVLNVDGRIGGFNFQWAWATGHLAGRGASETTT